MKIPACLLFFAFVVPVAHAQPAVIAHRGGPAYAPENTMLAFENAIRIGVDGIETDVRITKDGVPVLLHNDTLDATTNCSGKISQKTYAEISKCDAAYRFEVKDSTSGATLFPLRGKGIKVPKLEELFEYIKSLGDAAPAVYVEAKVETDIFAWLFNKFDCDNSPPLIYDLIDKYGLGNKVVVESFAQTCLDKIKLLNDMVGGNVDTMLLTQPPLFTYSMQKIKDSSNLYIAPEFNMLKRDLSYVGKIHSAGKKVATWTVDDTSNIVSMLGMGVDYIMSDYPACVLLAEGRPLPQNLYPDIIDASSPPKICAK